MGWKAETSLCFSLTMTAPRMIPVGYMLKEVTIPAPALVSASDVKAVYSLSNCVSSDFADYIPLWKHNGWWLFNTQKAVTDAADGLDLDLDQLTLFYYEAYDHQFKAETRSWQPILPDASFPTDVVAPIDSKFRGFDVVTFFAGTSPECSPLSCNGLASELPVNRYCLFDSFDDAFGALQQDKFEDGEPGPYRIIAVYEV